MPRNLNDPESQRKRKEDQARYYAKKKEDPAFRKKRKASQDKTNAQRLKVDELPPEKAVEVRVGRKLYARGYRLTVKESADYCLTESFQASCSEDEIILMDTAYYGRMSLGRCVKTDFGFVGCSAEVLGLADTRCSGRRRCVIRVPDPLLENTRPCNEEFKSYLQASYSCVRVIPAQSRRCQMAQPLRVTEQSGFLANVVTEESGCGTEDTPWAIEVQPGQRINLTLYDFSRVSPDATAISPHVSRGCVMYAHLRDDASTERVSVCGGGDRVRHVFTSVSSKLLVTVIKSYSTEGKRHFMLHYEAVGCADIVPPRGSWVRRDGENILMGCKSDDDVFKLTCSGHTWQGRRPNCTTDDPNGASSVLGVLSLPVGAAITLILAIAVGVSALILLAGLLVIRRRRAHDKKGARRQPNPSILMADGTLRRVKGEDPRVSSSGRQEGGKPPYSRQSLGQGNLNDNEYAYVWETNQSNSPHQTCQYCAENCNLALNIHAVDCGHYGVPCTAAPSRGESMYEKSTYSSGRQYHERGGHHHEMAGPQYFELDPEVLPKGSAPGRDSMPASVHGGRVDAEKLSSLRKYNASEGTLERGRGGDIDDQNRMNFMVQHVTS